MGVNPISKEKKCPPGANTIKKFTIGKKIINHKVGYFA
jgi:hypothetical protein